MDEKSDDFLVESVFKINVFIFIHKKLFHIRVNFDNHTIIVRTMRLNYIVYYP